MVVLGLLAIAAVVAAVRVVGGESAPAATERTATVTKGVVQSVVSGSGNLAPSKQLELDFGVSGKLVHIYTKAGERVTEGKLLARLDPTAANVGLAEARAKLADALDQLDNAETSSASSSSAPTAQSTAAPAATTPAASPTPSATRQSGGAGTSATSVASAEAAVASSQLAVQEAEDALTATDLRAPMAGTVASISGQVGDLVTAGSSGGSTAGSSGSASSGAAATGANSGAGGSSGSADSSSGGFITLASLRRLKMEVSLSESDIGDVKVGQSATVTINAIEGQKMAAHVTSIGVLSSSGSSSGTSGAVSYPVTVLLDQTAAGLRPGMSATADIVTARATGLVVPSQAVQGSTVTLARDGSRVDQRVETGVVGESSTQILTGLSVGDTVVMTSSAAAVGQSAITGNGQSSAAGARGLGRLGGGFGGGAAGGAGGGGRTRGGGAFPGGGPSGAP